MAKMREDDDEPLLVLNVSLDSPHKQGHEIWIARLDSTETGTFLGWLVRLKPHDRSKRSMVLTMSKEDTEVVRVLLFGAFEDVQQTCVLTQEAVEQILPSVLSTGMPPGTCLWVDFLESVRDV
jgi:hypothetical protein